jgi:2-keto-myo-inositol isomerase
MKYNRRESLLALGTAAGSLSAARTLAANNPTTPHSHPAEQKFRFCLNTSTIRGQKSGILREVELAAAAGYDGIEPWIPNLREFRDQGGSIPDLGKRIADAGLTVDSAIGFAQWIHPDQATRTQALEEARRDMDMLKQMGGTRIAAPPVGAHSGDAPVVELAAAAERFAALQKIGTDAGIIPQLEVWGFSKNLSRIGDVAWVAAETGHRDSCLLLDVYHIFKGGSDFAGLSLFSDQSLQVFHMNDFPADPTRDRINDSHRVYPGDGIAPLNAILGMLAGKSRTITLSLELFNPGYWQQDAAVVAVDGLKKMQAAVKAAGF